MTKNKHKIKCLRSTGFFCARSVGRFLIRCCFFFSVFYFCLFRLFAVTCICFTGTSEIKTKRYEDFKQISINSNSTNYKRKYPNHSQLPSYWSIWFDTCDAGNCLGWGILLYFTFGLSINHEDLTFLSNMYRLIFRCIHVVDYVPGFFFLVFN